MSTEEPHTNSPADVGYAPAPAITPPPVIDRPLPEVTPLQLRVLRAVARDAVIARKTPFLFARWDLDRMKCIATVTPAKDWVLTPVGKAVLEKHGAKRAGHRHDYRDGDICSICEQMRPMRGSR